jgi:hypothetical protein
MRPGIKVWLIAVVGLVVLLAGATPALAKDRNHNKIPDKWEKKYHMSLKKSQAKKDFDHDGLTSINEYRAATNPRRKDTDHDGVRDAGEDRDGDGLVNIAEVRSKTSLRVADTDHNGVLDSAEDADKDGLDNQQEFVCKTNPLLEDTNDDGILDAEEDADEDGLGNEQEFECGTNPRSDDSNHDGVIDSAEDPDGDGLDNESEFRCGTDPRAEDSDHNGIEDADEDADHDGYDNADEIEQGTDPWDGHEDGDDEGDVDDEIEIIGEVASFDPGTGILIITGYDEEATEYTVTVDGATELAWADAEDGDGTPVLDDLQPGTMVSALESEIQGNGSELATYVELFAPSDSDEGMGEVGAYHEDTGMLEIRPYSDEDEGFEAQVTDETGFEWTDEDAADHEASADDLVAGMQIADVELEDGDDGTPIIIRIVLVPAAD